MGACISGAASMPSRRHQMESNRKLPKWSTKIRPNSPVQPASSGSVNGTTRRGGPAAARGRQLERDTWPAHCISPISEYTEIPSVARRAGNDSLAGEDQTRDLAHASAQLEEPPQISDRQGPELPVGAVHGLHEVEQVTEALFRLGVDWPPLLDQLNALAQDGERGIDLATLPFLEDDLEHFPDVAHRLEIVPAVAQDVRHAHDPPPL